MKARIWPRKKSDRGGYACMPLKRNVPEGRKGWKLTACPKCGEPCWETPLFRSIAQSGAIPKCTMCALKKGMQANAAVNTDNRHTRSM